MTANERAQGAQIREIHQILMRIGRLLYAKKRKELAVDKARNRKGG